MSKHRGAFCETTPEISLRDAQAILFALKAAALVMADYGAANKQAREAISHYWQYPRLPQSHYVDGQYPEGCLWSKEALARWQTFPKNRKGARGKPAGSCNLRLEHLVPQSLFRAELLAQADALTAEQVQVKLDAFHEQERLVVLTKEQDDVLNMRGLQTSTPDPGRPWMRYAPIGLTEADCVVIDQSACHCAPNTDGAKAAKDRDKTHHSVSDFDDEDTSMAKRPLEAKEISGPWVRISLF